MDKKMNDMPFEEAMTELEQIVQKMEEGNIPLEEMIRQYESARKLADLCQKKLNGFRQKIEILTKSQDGGVEWSELPEKEAEPDSQDFFSQKDS